MNRARLLVAVREVEHLRGLADRAFNGIGYELTEVPSLQQALDRMRQEDFDVVIADDDRAARVRPGWGLPLRH